MFIWSITGIEFPNCPTTQGFPPPLQKNSYAHPSYSSPFQRRAGNPIGKEEEKGMVWVYVGSLLCRTNEYSERREVLLSPLDWVLSTNRSSFFFARGKKTHNGALPITEKGMVRRIPFSSLSVSISPTLFFHLSLFPLPLGKEFLFFLPLFRYFFSHHFFSLKFFISTLDRQEKNTVAHLRCEIPLSFFV